MLLAVIVAAVVAIVQATSGNDSRAAGYATGYFAAPAILSGLALGIWAKLAQSQWTWFAYIWRFVVGSIAILFLASMGKLSRWQPCDGANHGRGEGAPGHQRY